VQAVLFIRNFSHLSKIAGWIHFISNNNGSETEAEIETVLNPFEPSEQKT
jgi:hypothetical protein